MPLYFQIARQLEEQIGQGRLPSGSRIDSEVDLAERLGVSRPTVRQAIDRLVEQGLLVRRRGIGTMVVPRRVHRPVELTSLYDDLVAAGRTPSTTVLGIARMPADAVTALALSLPDHSPVICIHRLRLADDEPLGVMHNYLPPGLIEVTTESLESDGLYALLRRQGLRPQVAEQTIGARGATSAEARLLKGSKGLPVLTMSRTAFDASGRPIEHGSHCYRADRYSFEMSLVAR